MSVDISIIIPAFNVQDYIKEALGSALIQEPPFSRIIVVDDGSTDNTRQIIQNFSDPRIYYHYQDNQGLGPARNIGITLATSEYLYFMDGDDVLAEGMTTQIQEIIRNAAEKPDALLFSAVDFKHETGEISESSKYFQRKNLGSFRTGREALLRALKTNSIPAPVWLYVFKRSIIDQKPALRFLNIIHEDEIFTPDLLVRCNLTIVTNTCLYKRRIRAGSIMTAKSEEKNVAGLLLAAQKWIERCNNLPKEEVIYYTRQGHYLYCCAMRTAGHSKVGFLRTRKIVADFSPAFNRYFVFDYIIGRLSKKLAFKLGILRSLLRTMNA